MLSQLRPAIVMLVLSTALTGPVDPLAITGVAQFAPPAKVNGEMIEQSGKLVGSALIGHSFASNRYFHARPSATNALNPADASKTLDAPYNAANSSGSNLGATWKKLVDRVNEATDAEIATGRLDKVASDAVTVSASGLDLHISPQFERAQVEAGAGRGLSIGHGLASAMGGAMLAQSPAIRRRGTRIVMRSPAVESSKQGEAA